jgi:hypothetical protein
MSIQSKNDNVDVYDPTEGMTREEKISFLNARTSVLWKKMLHEIRFWGCNPRDKDMIMHEWTDGFFTSVRYDPFEREWNVHKMADRGGELIGTVEDTGVENDEEHLEKVNALIMEGKPE